jgi:FXSXX-COOH protein
VERVSGPTLRQPETRTEPAATAVLDARWMPLETLAQDAGTRRMVDEILARMDTPTRVSVAMFNSAI